jgi:broad specificity phosphatase PhoE
VTVPGPRKHFLTAGVTARSRYVSAVSTRIYLVRHGVTDWHAEKRILGQRDLGLSVTGRQQADATAAALAEVPLAEVLSSPLQRALETAQRIAEPRGIQVARDKRLTDFAVGRWEGMTTTEIAATPEFQRFLVDPENEGIPGGEKLSQVHERAVRAVEQALADTPSGEGVAVVSHASVVRVLLAHYLGSPPANYHRLRVAPGSVSVLEFDGDRALPRVLAVNWLPAGSITAVL